MYIDYLQYFMDDMIYIQAERLEESKSKSNLLSVNLRKLSTVGYWIRFLHATISDFFLNTRKDLVAFTAWMPSGNHPRCGCVCIPVSAGYSWVWVVAVADVFQPHGIPAHRLCSVFRWAHPRVRYSYRFQWSLVHSPLPVHRCHCWS